MSNLISASLPAADQADILTALTTIREKLPFLLGLTPEQRRSLCRMGDKSRAFVDRALELATQNADLMPRCLDVEEMRRDLELVEALYPILFSIGQLKELIEDTYLLAGSEAYSAARTAYNSARANGKTMGLSEAVDQMGRHFSRKSRKTKTPSSQA
ncbi:hypothetical protein H6G89_09735 [Oscillatoria sp. FACHB-1407]|uniref:hypothetical protein n=1 Tax=Oscillatoria sp. FACHB-1407 TaxID=2692847 RepID=UPI001682F05F|nr:hypothetical protein [Oscillatoria sp. FACHB-1407]MBD2461327.1 hypothetical protein [Oscillatoria sp. FACHB-1407]